MRSKTLALLLVAVIASGIVFAVSAQSQITAADIAKAILPGGIINPKAIMPGAITEEHIGPDAVGNDELKNTDDFTMNSLNVTSGPFVSTGASYLNETKIGTDASHKSLNVTGSLIVLDPTYLNETKIGTDANPKSLNVTGDLIVTSHTYLNDTTIDTGNTFDAASASAVKLPGKDKALSYITVHNNTYNFTITSADKWIPILNTSDAKWLDETAEETVTPVVDSIIIITYSGNVTCAAGDIYVKCKIGNESNGQYYEAILNKHKVGDKEDCKVHFSVPFFYDNLVAENTYNVTIFAKATATPSAIANQTLTAIVIPK